MTDQGAQRRTARRFEPPPWERDQFEELQKQREAPEVVALPEQEPEPIAALVAEEVPAAAPAASEVREPAPGIDQKAFGTMMFQLRAEEPSAGKAGWQMRVAVAIFLLILGTVLMLFGMVAVVKVMRTGPEQRMLAGLVSAALLLFGAGFVGLSGWLGYKAYQQRGVR